MSVPGKGSTDTKLCSGNERVVHQPSGSRPMPAFCAQYSRNVAEPLSGSGAHLRSNLLLSWPSVYWTRIFHQARDMTIGESRLVADLVDQGRRVNLIHRKSQPQGVHRAYLMPEQRVYNIPRAELVDFLRALQTGEPLEAWLDGPVDRRLMLCCTHGKKDKCCAKFGNAGFKALVQAASTMPGQFDIWQSTHLGGCRFAASALMFPAMHKYGRVDTDHALALLLSESEGQPYLPCYRGNGALSPHQQVAEFEVRKELAQRGCALKSLDLVSEQVLADQQIRISFDWQGSEGQGELTVTLREQTVSRFGTCADMNAGESPTEQRIWFRV